MDEVIYGKSAAPGQAEGENLTADRTRTRPFPPGPRAMRTPQASSRCF